MRHYLSPSILPRKMTFLWTFLSVLVWILSSCGSDSDSKSAAMTYSTLHQVGVFSDCSNCHVPEGEVFTNGVGLNFTNLDTSFATLTTLKSASPSNAACADIPYVTAQNPARSYLAAVIIEDLNTPGFGDKENCNPYNVHIEEGYLTSTQQGDVKKWITDGANK